ncbi:MAG: ABC transporter ATP-binding protein [Pseudomonadota bacterium]
MAAVDMDGVRKAFGDTVAVDTLNLSIDDGELVTLLGPSGCGKTTLMRMIAGILHQDEGEIRIGGQAIDDLPPEQRNIGMVFQSYALFPHMTVRHNVGFGLRMRGVDRAESTRRVDDALALVDLSALAERYPRALSGGQQQRVAVARAVVIEPDVLLFDEPLSNLDAKLREQLREDLSKLQERLGITSLYVTHDQSEAMALADRIVVMNEGRIVEIGTPIDLYRRPRHRFTAEFLGQTNVVEARIENGTIMLPWGQRLPRPIGGAGSLALSLRPEDLRIAAAEPDHAQGQVRGRTFLGAAVDYRVDLDGHSLRVHATGQAAPVLEIGQPITLHLPEQLHMLEEDKPHAPAQAA